MPALRALGRLVTVPEQPSLDLLEGIPRALGRAALPRGIRFSGLDLWRAHEISWCRPDGRPEVALAHLTFAAASPRLVESKSLKLALGSLNFAVFPGPEALVEELAPRLAEVAGAPVGVELFGPRRAPPPAPPLVGVCLDDLAVAPAPSQPDAELLAVDQGGPTREVLFSHLLRSLCPVTGQPDWATLVVDYRGRPLCRRGLLRYILSFRRHASFHEGLVERVWCDILAHCQPTALTVWALFTCRGGIDISPLRSTGAATCPLRATYRR